LETLFPHLPQAGANAGDERRWLRNVNAAGGKPNEDAVIRASRMIR
jgi:hypothetical protein